MPSISPSTCNTMSRRSFRHSSRTRSLSPSSSSSFRVEGRGRGGGSGYSRRVLHAVHTPIKIEATQGQVTLCSENFPDAKLAAAAPPVLASAVCACSDDSSSRHLGDFEASFRLDQVTDGPRDEDEPIAGIGTSCRVCRRWTRDKWIRAAVAGSQLSRAGQRAVQLRLRQGRQYPRQGGSIRRHRDRSWRHFRTRHTE